MKKKLFLLGALAFLSTLSISGCSFLSDFSPSDSGSGSGGKQNSGELDVWTIEPRSEKPLVLQNRITSYQVDDIFVMPTVYLVDVNGNEHEVTSKATVSDKESKDRDYSKKTDVDMSKTTDDKGMMVAISYQFYVDKSNGTRSLRTLSTSYYIHITNRRDAHYDPETDLTIKTLQITDVYTSFEQGGEYLKPKVWAVKYDNTKTDVTNYCVYSGYDMSTYGYQDVQITYNDHTLSYEIVVHNREEEKDYPFLLSSYSLRLNIQCSLFVTDQKGEIYYIGYQDDGTVKKYGASYETFLKGVKYSSDNTSVIKIDENNGLFTAIAPGTAFIYARLDETVLRAKITVEDRRPVKIEVNNYKYNYYSGSSFNFAGEVYVTYQNGYSEMVVPTVDASDVDSSTPGQYSVGISYTVNGYTVSTTKNIQILDSSLYTLSKTTMKHNITEYENNYIASALPLSGELKSLIVPVKFNDSDLFISNYANVREDIEKCFFGTNEEVGWRSVKTYYEEESAGRITFGGKVTDVYYDADHSYMDYAESTNLNAKLKNNIIDWYFSSHPEEDIKDYDTNHDGYFDGLNIVYLSPDAVCLGIGRQTAGNLWGMVKSSRDKPANVEYPVADKYFWVSYDFIYPTKEIALARTGKSNYSEPALSTGNTNPTNIKLDARTFIHETGHMFGIDDYYSYTEDDVYFAGEKNMQTSNYMGHDPYSLLLYNWAEPYIPETTTTISIGDFQTTHDVILLTPSWNNLDSPFDEYFLIDLYIPSSGLNEFDATIWHPSVDGFNTVGIRIWHVDARLATKGSQYEVFTFDPNELGMSKITDNSYGRVNDDYLEKYDRFMELQLVRNEANYDYKTSGRLLSSQYFFPGDTFSMSQFSSQFVNGTKMDNGKDLGWTVNIDGIYYSSEGYSADITVTKL